MEHWLVALGSDQGDAALDWAARHAGRRAALEVIASGLEIPDPRAAVLRAADVLEATCPRVPRALHAVPYSLAEELARYDSVDLVVLGSPTGPLAAADTNRVLGLLRVCRSSVVLVPAGAAGDTAPRDVAWPAAGRRPPAALRAEVRSGRDILRVVRTSAASPLGPRS
ncbi:MAG TPA: hypothetical protein VFQ74_10985 [Pseudolysinimonas sp.]|nr:hypothetical protein [Pseudolysinimonas sp.]